MLPLRQISNYFLAFRLSGLVLALAMVALVPARAGDWGYDDNPPGANSGGAIPVPEPEIVPARAKAGVLAAPGPFGYRKPAGGTAPKLLPVRPGTAGKPAAKPRPQGTPPQAVAPPVKESGSRDGLSTQATPEDTAVNYWLQMYQIVSQHPFADEQRIEAREFLQDRVSKPGPLRDEILSINRYWSQVVVAADRGEDAEQAYAELFRSLLRYRMRALQDRMGKDATSSEYLMPELNTLSAILGPTRLAVVLDSASLTEDAVNAYADMACQLYSEQNPGKSIDASDNREMFAKVICEKFRAAPSDKDRKAMANFDLIWAKYKVLWEQADQATRKQMLSKLASAGAGAAIACTQDATLELVLKNWPAGVASQTQK